MILTGYGYGRLALLCRGMAVVGLVAVVVRRLVGLARLGLGLGLGGRGWGWGMVGAGVRSRLR